MKLGMHLTSGMTIVLTPPSDASRRPRRPDWQAADAGGCVWSAPSAVAILSSQGRTYG